MRKLKVWGWAGFPGTGLGQRRCVIAATSRNKAAVEAGSTPHFFSHYAAETGNVDERKVALSTPGQVYYLDEQTRKLILAPKKVV